MAPLSRSTRLSPKETLTVSGNLFKILLFIAIIVATAFELYVVVSLRRKRIRDHQITMQEKEHAMSSTKEDDCTSTKRKDSVSSPKIKQEDPRPHHPEDPNQRLQAIQQELSSPALEPVYPWIAPPTPLPGPYDAPYYPLPIIRRHSDALSCDTPETQQTVSYTRRVSANQDSILRGTTTVSNHGWRRTQWTVATG
jgi:hypothetical protein